MCTINTIVAALKTVEVGSNGSSRAAFCLSQTPSRKTSTKGWAKSKHLRRSFERPDYKKIRCNEYPSGKKSSPVSFRMKSRSRQ